MGTALLEAGAPCAAVGRLPASPRRRAVAACAARRRNIDAAAVATAGAATRHAAPRRRVLAASQPRRRVGFVCAASATPAAVTAAASAQPPPPGSTAELLSDVVAGVSVAFVCVPQSLAYASLAGLSPTQGLHSNAVAPFGAAPFASSRYLQTGACAMSSILTGSVLLSLGLAPGSATFCGAATLMALMVGTLRCVLGALKGGAVLTLLPHTVLDGFVTGACWLVFAAQLPVILGATPPAGMHFLAAGAWLLARPALWQPGAIATAAATAVCLLGGKKLHPLLPGAVIATMLGCAASSAGLPVGETVGAISAGLPTLIDPRTLPWHLMPQLASAAAAIAVAGVAEACAIGSRYALQDGEEWDATRELTSQGTACLAVAAFGGFPVAGSLSRSSLAHTAGARTQRSHVFTGLAVLVFLPLGAPLLAALPRAVLGGLIACAVFPVLRPAPSLLLTRALKARLERALRSAGAREAPQQPPQQQQRRSRWPHPPTAFARAHTPHPVTDLLLGWATLAATLVAGRRLELGFQAGLLLAAILAAAQAAAAAWAARRDGDSDGDSGGNLAAPAS